MTHMDRTFTAEVVIESICCCSSTELLIQVIVEQVRSGAEITPAGLRQLWQLCVDDPTGRLEETLNLYEKYGELFAA